MKSKNVCRKRWEQKQCERAKIVLTIVGIIIGLLGLGEQVLAEETAIKSKGNIKIEDVMYFYGKDIQYLEEEIEKLEEECNTGGRV